MMNNRCATPSRGSCARLDSTSKPLPPVTVSSTHPDFPDSARALVDEVVASYDMTSCWSSAPIDPTPTITIDLGRVERLDAVALQFCGLVEKKGWYDYRHIPGSVSVDTAGDDGVFETVVRESRDVPVPHQLYKQWFYRYPLQRSGRHVRIRLGPSAATDDPSQCVRLAEVRVIRKAGAQ